MQSIVCLGVIYSVCRRFAAGSGLAMICMLYFFLYSGGLDFWAALAKGLIPMESHIEWWSMIPIASFYAMFVWVPQHLIVAVTVIVVIYLLFFIDGNKTLRSTLIGISFSFMFGSSPFVFIGFAVAYVVWSLIGLLHRWKRHYLSVRDHLIVASLFGLLSMSQFQSYLGRESLVKIKFSSFKMISSLFESGISRAVDIILSVPIYLFIELGLPFCGFILWCLWKRKQKWGSLDLLLFLMCVVYTPIMFVLQGAGGNISNRGMIPAQMGMIFTTGILISSLNIATSKRKVILAFSILVVLSHSPSMLYEAGRRILGTNMRLIQDVTGLERLPFTKGRAWPSLEAYRWMDNNLPLHSVILVDRKGPPHSHIHQYAHRLAFVPLSHFKELTETECMQMKKYGKNDLFFENESSEGIRTTVESLVAEGYSIFILTGDALRFKEQMEKGKMQKIKDFREGHLFELL